MPSELEAFVAGNDFDQSVANALGDTILYRAAGEAAYRGVIGFAQFDEAINPGGVGAIGQQFVIEVFKSAVPVRPDKDCRVQIAQEPGKTFCPANVLSNESGSGWTFGLKNIP